MPRDYKHINKSKKKPADKQELPLAGNLLSFVTGLTIGLFIAFLVYLEKIALFEHLDLPALFSPAEERPSTQDRTAETGKQPEVPSPTFDFYKILPNKEINISEYVAEDTGPEDTDEPVREPPPAEEGIYVLQVGSFREFEAADRLQAELALLGIDPEIQRVVINGQDIHYRVRVGPYQDMTRINAIRQRLRENNLEFMLLKLEADEQ